MDAVLLRALVVAAVVAAVVVAGLWRRRREGRLRVDGSALTPDELRSVGLPEAPARALLLSSPTCAPCVTVRELLGEVERERPGFAWTSVDAGDHLDLVRRHRVMRVPTLFVLDRDGHVVARTSGVPDRRELVAVIERAI